MFKFIEGYEIEVGFIIFILTFFSLILYNRYDHHIYKESFKVQCEQAGGITYMLGDVEGQPQLECVDPDSIIHIDIKEK